MSFMCKALRLPGIEDWVSLHALLVIGSRRSEATQSVAVCMKLLVFVFQPALLGTSGFYLFLVKENQKFVWDRNMES